MGVFIFLTALPCHSFFSQAMQYRPAMIIRNWKFDRGLVSYARPKIFAVFSKGLSVLQHPPQSPLSLFIFYKSEPPFLTMKSVTSSLSYYLNKVLSVLPVIRCSRLEVYGDPVSHPTIPPTSSRKQSTHNPIHSPPRP